MLRALDARLVPAAARALRRFGAGAVAAVQLPSLRRLDRRFAASGPLGYVREVPQVGLLVVAAVFVAGALSAASLQPARPASQQPADSGPLVLGPGPGQDVASSFAAARTHLLAVAAARPGARYLALVTFTAYRPVGDATSSDPALVVRRAYLRAPGVSGAQVLEVPVPQQGAVPSLLPETCAATATRKVADAADLRNLAASIDPASPALRQQKDDLARQAAREDAEAAAYRPPCRTLFALVVEGDAGRLARVLTAEGVRGVELARAGAQLSQLQVRPVPPDVTDVVPSAAPS